MDIVQLLVSFELASGRKDGIPVIFDSDMSENHPKADIDMTKWIEIHT